MGAEGDGRGGGRAPRRSSPLADRLAHLARRYGSDAAAWQHEIHAVAALEGADPKLALERFYDLKRRFAQFRRSQLLDLLRAFPFVHDLPPNDTRGWETKEIEAEIREATRALAHARAIARAVREAEEARAGLQMRAGALALDDRHLVPAPWNALAALADATEQRRRLLAREARLDRRLAEAHRRARKLDAAPALPDAALGPEALDEALDAIEPRLDALEALVDALHAVLDPMRAPDVATYRYETRRALEREARRLAAAEDLAGLRALLPRAEALRREAAALASQAARSRRKGGGAPERERRASDTMDGYG